MLEQKPGSGLIAGDWSKEIGANYAPPSFLGADYEGGTPAAPDAAPVQEPPAAEYKSQIVDPIGDVIAQLKAGKTPSEGTAAPAEEEKSVDPLAEIMAEIRGGKGAKKEAAAFTFKTK